MNTAVQSPNTQLTLWRTDDQPLPLSITDCSLKWNSDTDDGGSAPGPQNALSQLTIQCTLSPTHYQHIIRESWFNLSLEAQSAESIPSFHKDIPIQLELTLNPNLLAQWDRAIATPEAALTHLFVQYRQNQSSVGRSPTSSPVLTTAWSWVTLS